jgi:hypothetical protein
MSTPEAAPGRGNQNDGPAEILALQQVDRDEIRFWLHSVYRYQHSGYHRLERSPEPTAAGTTAKIEDQALYERLSKEGLIAVATQRHPFNHVVLTPAGREVLRAARPRLGLAVE